MRSRKSFLGNSPGFAGGRAARLRPVPRSRAAPGGRGAGGETEGPRPRSGNGLRDRGLQRDGRPAGPRSPWKVPASRVRRGAAPSSAPWRPASLGTPPGRHRQPLHAADSRQLAFPAPPSRIAGRDPGDGSLAARCGGFGHRCFPTRGFHRPHRRIAARRRRGGPFWNPAPALLWGEHTAKQGERQVLQLTPPTPGADTPGPHSPYSKGSTNASVLP